MTPEMFRYKAQELYDRNEGYAGEEGHMEVDALMSNCLRQLGYEEGLEILWSMTDFWYS
jgi:hypothetical protein